jgi:hypothetical protein
MLLHRSMPSASYWKDFPSEGEPNAMSVSLQGCNARALLPAGGKDHSSNKDLLSSSRSILSAHCLLQSSNFLL